ncbi:hypothetical protein [Peribacillus glennii]|uniref:Uncharacterized protein n=1 Tax=Peribacillus glennii TaxID=2303991 RepID=A0A372LGP3_9BACI|nr:hypothetical protein [Peribacillus glennii]RFU65470.1 hypothetical protein D0466_06165 [Peribacillus glennii]
MAAQKITKEEEIKLPVFNSHLDAVKHFKNKYGDDFVLKSQGEKNGEKIYIYVLLLDKEAFKEGQEKLARFEMVPPEFTNSFQSIEIMENGDLRIAY